MGAELDPAWPVLERPRPLPELPPDLVWLVRTALSRQRSARFQSAAAFSIALGAVALRLGLTLDASDVVTFLGRAGILPSSSGTMEAQTAGDALASTSGGRREGR